MKPKQRGNTFVGIVIGLVIGLAAALAVAVYVTKVPIPFVNKGSGRSADQEAAESRKNQNWDPNAPLYGKNPAKPLPPAPGIPASAAAAAPAAPAAPAASVAAVPAPAREAEKSRAEKSPEAPAVIGRPAPADPLGDLAAARSNSGGADPFIYFVQAGAFRTPEDAEAQRAKLSLMGIEAKVTEREQSGRQVFRVRVGPFNNKDEADRQKDKLDSGGFDTALVRVQR